MVDVICGQRDADFDVNANDCNLGKTVNPKWRLQSKLYSLAEHTQGLQIQIQIQIQMQMQIQIQLQIQIINLYLYFYLHLFFSPPLSPLPAAFF